MIYISSNTLVKELSSNDIISIEDGNKNSIIKYDKTKWKKIMDTTQSNYANMVKRLTRKSKFSNFILIYYSIFLIVTTLTIKYFNGYYNPVLSEYFSIILSVVILAYSLINNNANYGIRIYNIENSLNDLKNLKRKLDQGSLEECVEKYNDITDKTERREDIDFFHTIRSLAKLYNISIFTKKPKKRSDGEIDREKVKVVTDYLADINVFIEISKMILEYAWYLIVILIPVLVFIICIVCK